ncbi:MAG TPA: hypothetical protein VE262_11340 [Blastocatellia bacterium]|nr:hypothetical protein [Blastocatellia bacterium]
MNRNLLMIFAALSLCPALCAQAPGAQEGRTIIKDKQARARLLGEHRLSLQWISWDYFGKAVVRENKGVLSIAGEQKGRGTGDYLKIEGVITEVDTTEIKFKGTIETRVSHINQGNPCKREGEMTFRITQNRRYWRLKEMDNPCDEATDYVDIYFR